MYRAVFKCRLCGETAEQDISRLKAKSICERIIAQDYFIPIENPKAIHSCRNGSKEIMDLQGFRFYGDK